MSTNTFALADEHPPPATIIALHEKNIRALSYTVNMVPALANQSLLSRGKLLEAGYLSVCDGEDINIYDGHTNKSKVSEKAVLT